MAILKRTKSDVKSKKVVLGKVGKNGKKRKLGVKVTFNDNTDVTLLNPSGKGAKYAKELKDGKRYTNDGKVKTDDNGNELTLSKEQRVYRSAYLTALSDSAKAFNSKNTSNH